MHRCAKADACDVQARVKKYQQDNGNTANSTEHEVRTGQDACCCTMSWCHHHMHGGTPGALGSLTTTCARLLTGEDSSVARLFRHECNMHAVLSGPQHTFRLTPMLFSSAVKRKCGALPGCVVAEISRDV